MYPEFAVLSNHQIEYRVYDIVKRKVSGMMKTSGDYLIFSGCILHICAVISIIINTTGVGKMLKTDKKLIDKISFYKSKWNKENYWRYIAPVLIYIIISCVAAIFKLISVLIISSVFLVVIYTRVNRLMIKYVEQNVINNQLMS